MLDWAKFERASGAHPNAHAFSFESLCRGIVTRYFRQHGSLKELKNQPGVEFHLELSFDDTRLGFKGQHVGWQCKWFQYRADGGLTATAKDQIQHSLKKTKEHLPNINIWILWTHKTLSKSDQQWFYNLKAEYGFDLQLWNENDLDSFLTGPAIELRATYFEEFALSPIMLEEQHRRSVAPIKSRWLHEIHQFTETERDIRRILGEPIAWSSIQKVRTELIFYISEIIEMAKLDKYEALTDDIDSFVVFCQQVIEKCGVFGKAISGRDMIIINAIATSVNEATTAHQLLRMLRRQNLPLSLYITNANALVKDIKILLKKACKLLSQQVIAVIGRAGGGKTQLSAELTGSSSNRIAGVLLLGRDLRKGGTLDSLVKGISFDTRGINTFEMLVSAIDAAGERNKCRVPIVIDGLNEAEDPREWKALLASSKAILVRYPNVILICTLRAGEAKRKIYGAIRKDHSTREGFAQQALPDDCYMFELPKFNKQITLKAIRAYFNHYKIIANPLVAPVSFFNHPLNLKIFCEVTNRSRNKEVRVSSFPSSIYSLFNEQVSHSSRTISEMTNLSVRYSFTDVENAVYYFGETLWLENRRSIPENKFLEKLTITSPDWESNIVNLLSQEGLLFRDLEGRGRYKLAPAYDRLGGYIIAFYLMEIHCKASEVGLFKSTEFVKKIFGDVDPQCQHELAEDILHALVALAPKNHLTPMWQNVPKEYKNNVIKLSHLIDPSHICDKTIQELKDVILEEGLSRQIIETLGDIRHSVFHPLNAKFLSNILFELPLIDRDLSWGEYFRKDFEGLIDGIKSDAKRWYENKFDDPELEQLRVLLMFWFLSSNVIGLRDVSTQAITNYGVSNTEDFLRIAESFFEVNDPYIIERVIAASYAVVCINLDKSKSLQIIEDFTIKLIDKFFSEQAVNSTCHVVLRGYAECLVARVALEDSIKLSEPQIQTAIKPFVLMPRHPWKEIQTNGMCGRSSPLHMDFENYTIGRLVHGRSNYDYEHQEYQKIRDRILWRTNDLGWSKERFGDIDERIASTRRYGRLERSKVERYGKKYAWIAYYEIAGELQDSNKLKLYGYRFEAGIDPFFPQQLIQSLEFSAPQFLGLKSDNTDVWVSSSEIPTIIELSLSDHFDNSDWTLLSAFIIEESKDLDRHFYCSLNSYLVPKVSSEELHIHDEFDFPDSIEISDIYLGEVHTTWKPEQEKQVIRIKDGTERLKIESNIIFEGAEFVIKDEERYVEFPKYKEIQIEDFLIEYNSNRDGQSDSIPMLSPNIVEMLNLSFNVQKLSYFDELGEQVSMFSLEKEGDDTNVRSRFYLKNNLIQKLLSECGVEIVTRVNGERRVNNVDSRKYKDFEQVLLSSEPLSSS